MHNVFEISLVVRRVTLTITPLSEGLQLLEMLKLCIPTVYTRDKSLAHRGGKDKTLQITTWAKRRVKYERK